MSKFSKWCKKAIGHRAYVIISKPVKSAAKKAVQVKISTSASSMSDANVKIMKVPIPH